MEYKGTAGQETSRAGSGTMQEMPMFNAGSYMISVAEMDEFIDAAEKVFTEDEYEELILFLAKYPDAGETIPDTGGVRMVRWPAKALKKRGAALVIYYFRDLNVPVYLIAALPKAANLNLTESEKEMMRDLVEDIVRNAMARRVRLVKRA